MLAKNFKWICFVVYCLVLLFSQSCVSLHIEGIWSPSSTLLKVITRFGIQKTDQNHQHETSGYAFGNVTLLTHKTNSLITTKVSDLKMYDNAILLLVNRTLFKRIYNMYSHQFNDEGYLETSTQSSSNQTQLTRDLFCQKVFNLLDSNSFFNRGCYDPKKSHYLRYVPCQEGKSCGPSKNSSVHLPNYQFTFSIGDQKDATFWYLLLVSCRSVQNESKSTKGEEKCLWQSSYISTKSVLSYDVWLVNGHPSSASNLPIDFDNQFSFEQQNLWVYIILNVSYMILLVFQFYVMSKQKWRSIGYVFTVSLILHSLSYFFICLHKIVFAHNGKGFETLFTISEIMRIISTGMFIFFVLAIAKGWPITKPEILSKTILLIFFSLYIFIKILLFIWMKNSLNMIEEIDEYHTIPGWISLSLRILLMLWFLHELRHTMMLEQDSRRLKFYLHFGAGMLVWFVHLPLVAMVVSQIELMWRYKIITGFTSAADLLAYAIVTRLIWQVKHKKPFLSHDSELEFNDDDDFDENPISHSETYKFSHAVYNMKHSYDNHSCDSNIIKA